MRTVRHVFQEVIVKGTKRWVDSEGKKRQFTKSFSQTINPFNLNSLGIPKSHSEIMTEITAERDKWLTNTSLRK